AERLSGLQRTPLGTRVAPLQHPARSLILRPWYGIAEGVSMNSLRFQAILSGSRFQITIAAKRLGHRVPAPLLRWFRSRSGLTRCFGKETARQFPLRAWEARSTTP